MDFNGFSTHLGLFYAYRLGNHVPCTLYFHFLCCCFFLAHRPIEYEWFLNRSILINNRYCHSRSELTREIWQWKDNLQSPKLQNCDLSIRCSVVSCPYTTLFAPSSITALIIPIMVILCHNLVRLPPISLLQRGKKKIKSSFQGKWPCTALPHVVIL